MSSEPVPSALISSSATSHSSSSTPASASSSSSDSASLPTSHKRSASSLSRGILNVSSLPVYFQGEVIKGFGRGSKQLGIPTANLPVTPYEHVLSVLPVGVYAGFARLQGRADTHKMAMSIGWNPYFKNQQKTIEVHLLHSFPDDFYGSVLSCVAVHYIREEYDFISLDDLIRAIQDDITYTSKLLDKAEYSSYKQDKFLE